MQCNAKVSPLTGEPQYAPEMYVTLLWGTAREIFYFVRPARRHVFPVWIRSLSKPPNLSQSKNKPVPITVLIVTHGLPPKCQLKSAAQFAIVPVPAAHLRVIFVWMFMTSNVQHCPRMFLTYCYPSYSLVDGSVWIAEVFLPGPD